MGMSRPKKGKIQEIHVLQSISVYHFVCVCVFFVVCLSFCVHVCTSMWFSFCFFVLLTLYKPEGEEDSDSKSNLKVSVSHRDSRTGKLQKVHIVTFFLLKARDIIESLEDLEIQTSEGKQHVSMPVIFMPPKSISYLPLIDVVRSIC